MNIHEYQAKALLHDYGAPVADGYVATTPQEAVSAAGKLKPGAWVVKAQIHAGGRGKGGGIKLVKTLEELRGQAERLLGKPLVTPQTGPKGRPVAQVYVVEDIAIGRELYLSLLVDRDSGRVAFIASTEGGVNIEEVAVKTPEKITTLTVDPASGLWPFHTRIIASALKLEGDQAKQCARLVSALYRLFLDKDASLIEINPVVVTKDGKLICLDAKIGFDDNAVFRHPDIEALRDFDQEEPAEVEASRLGLSYVKLDGTIGCMVNGAGLAMATMDIIKLRGGEPANFLDVGGGASKEKIAEAFKIILSDPHVKGVLVNIFGGIMRCDVIAEGIIEAVREVKIGVPLVVRLEGTNVARGKTLLQESGLSVIPADDLDDAARKIVAAVKDAA
jgi:succinyl-CoA synthetase beta subunit